MRAILVLVPAWIAVAGCGPSGSQPSGTAAGPGELFSMHCGKCHGLNGAASSGPMKGPDLSRADADAAHTAAWIAEHIRNPKAHKPGSRMPAFAEKLKAEEIQSLADYLAALK